MTEKQKGRVAFWYLKMLLANEKGKWTPFGSSLREISHVIAEVAEVRGSVSDSFVEEVNSSLKKRGMNFIPHDLVMLFGEIAHCCVGHWYYATGFDFSRDTAQELLSNCDRAQNGVTREELLEYWGSVMCSVVKRVCSPHEIEV